jgi:hypothetical protein
MNKAHPQTDEKESPFKFCRLDCKSNWAKQSGLKNLLERVKTNGNNDPMTFVKGLMDSTSPWKCEKKN